MMNIIKSDIYRLIRGKAIYIILAIISMMAVTSVVGMSAGHMGLSVSSNMTTDMELMEKLSKVKGLGEFREVMKSMGNFALDKEIIGQNINLYYFFIAFTIIVICIDFTNKSIKNSLSSAITRKKYYLSKLFLLLGLGTVLILFNNYLSYFLNLFINGEKFSTPIMEFTKYTLSQLPLLYGLISIQACFAFIFKKTSVFSIVSIPFIMVLQLVVMGFTNLFRIKADWFYDYEAQFALSKLVSDPTNKYVATCIILGIIYVVLFNAIGYYSFKKVEIK